MEQKIKSNVDNLVNLIFSPCEVYLFGTGTFADLVLKYLDKDKLKPVGFFDNNSQKTGLLKSNLKIEKPRYLSKIKVIIASQNAKEIFYQLTQLGYNESDIFEINDFMNYQLIPGESDSDTIRYKYFMPMNIVLHKYRTIYFYIPKVACTSLRTVFLQLLGISPSAPTNRHISLRNLEYPSETNDKINSNFHHYFKFCFVRNPWDRLVSCYLNKILSKSRTDYYFKNGIPRTFFKYGEAFHSEMPFEEFVDAICNIPDEDSNNHFKSQHKFVSDSNGEPLVDFIGKFEKMEEDFSHICRKLNIKKIELPRIRINRNRKPYQYYYNKETIEKVRKRYSKDIEMFGYVHEH